MKQHSNIYCTQQPYRDQDACSRTLSMPPDHNQWSSSQPLCKTRNKQATKSPRRGSGVKSSFDMVRPPFIAGVCLYDYIENRAVLKLVTCRHRSPKFSLSRRATSYFDPHPLIPTNNLIRCPHPITLILGPDSTYLLRLARKLRYNFLSDYWHPHLLMPTKTPPLTVGCSSSNKTRFRFKQ